MRRGVRQKCDTKRLFETPKSGHEKTPGNTGDMVLLFYDVL